MESERDSMFIAWPGVNGSARIPMIYNACWCLQHCNIDDVRMYDVFFDILIG